MKNPYLIAIFIVLSIIAIFNAVMMLDVNKPLAVFSIGFVVLVIIPIIYLYAK